MSAATHAPLDVAAIRARAERATPGPWAWAQTAEKGYGANVGGGCFADDDDGCARPLSGDLSGRDDFSVTYPVAETFGQGAAGDAEFVAHARTDVPALCAEVERLRAALTSDDFDVATYLDGCADREDDAGYPIMATAINAAVARLRAALAPATPEARDDA